MTNIRFESDATGIATLTFDRTGAPFNLLDVATLEELDACLTRLDNTAGLRGVIFASAKPSGFLAGADLKAVRQMSEEALAAFVSLGQRVFDRVAGLRVPTAALLHGVCVGGGYELALACRFRLASDSPATRIGLPETKLGILPAWGGCTRLPARIGVTRALGVILEGATPPAAKALKLGLVDAVMPVECLRDAALERFASGVTPRVPPRWRNVLATAIGEPVARRRLLAKTHGWYPAQEEALATVCAAPLSTHAESLRREREALARLATTEACKNQMRLYFLAEAAKHQEHDAPAVEAIEVVGAGVMGAGIAAWCAAHGVRVTLREVDEARAAAGLARVKTLLEENPTLTAIGARDALDRVLATAGPVPLTRTPLVVEAATERLEVKKRIFAELDARAPAGCVLGTNTSALPLAALADATGDAARVVGIHFFNPVSRMPLVEVVVGRDTSEAARAVALAFARRIGKLPVVVRDKPGFLVNRVLMPYLVEAMRLFDAGVDARAIDGAMVDFGMPVGPLRLLDEVGLDVAGDVSATLVKAYGERLAPPALAEAMVGAGLLGHKSGAGFYRHAPGRHARVNPGALALRSAVAPVAMAREEIADRLSVLLFNEAVRCLEEGVVDSPDDIDFALVMGAGYAPARGGPLRTLDALGVREVLSTMRRLEMESGPHYAPAVSLVKHAEANRPFHAR